ncbi:MAG: hypothetical protein NTV21_20495 [Planctomycetota bacterium]|nr:hypothetical protein [Planctomycetota bacterium]
MLAHQFLRHRSLGAPRGRRGHSIVEVTIAATVLMSVFGAVGVVTQRGARVSEEGISSTTVENAARRAVDRVASELTNCQAASLPLPPASQRAANLIEFQRAEGYAGGNVLLSNERRLLRVASPGDANDGLDNDSDGLVDEGDLVLIPDTSDPDSPNVVLATGVAEMTAGEIAGNSVDDNGNGLIDEPGVSFVWDANGLVVRILVTLQRVGAQGQVYTRTSETTVGIRN